MKRVFIILFVSLATLLPAAAQRLTVGGYGEVALSRNFYSDNVYRYSSADTRFSPLSASSSPISA